MPVLDDILDLTDAVEACVDQGDWLEAGRLNTRRQQLLVELCGDGDAAALEPAARAALRDVLDRNRATEARLQRERDHIAASARQIRRGHDAVDAYRLNSGPIQREP